MSDAAETALPTNSGEWAERILATCDRTNPEEDDRYFDLVEKDVFLIIQQVKSWFGKTEILRLQSELSEAKARVEELEGGMHKLIADFKSHPSYDTDEECWDHIATQQLAIRRLVTEKADPLAEARAKAIEECAKVADRNRRSDDPGNIAKAIRSLNGGKTE